MAKAPNIDFDGAYIAGGASASITRTNDVLAKYKVLDKATEAGSRDEPATSDQSLDDIQRALWNECREVVDQLVRGGRREIGERIDGMRQRMPMKLDTKLERAAIKRAALEASNTYGEDFQQAHDNLVRRHSALRAFEEKNQLAPYSAKSSADLLMSTTVLGAVTIGESVLSAFQLQELQAGGFVGGWALAAGVGLANVILGVGTGFFGVRLIRHVDRRKRTLGVIITAILSTAALSLHLALGAVRDAIDRGGSTAIDFLIILKPWDWFDYSGVSPFVMVAIGVGSFVVAVYKSSGGAHSFCSEYVGHDAVDRQYREAELSVDDARANYSNATQNAFEGEREKVRARLEENRADVAEIRRLRGEGLSIARRVVNSITDEIGRLGIWLRKYRDRNSAVRSSLAPEYFKDYPTASEFGAGECDTTELEALAAEADAILAENVERLAALEEATLQDQIVALELLSGTETAIRDRALKKLAEDRTTARPSNGSRRSAA